MTLKIILKIIKRGAPAITAANGNAALAANNATQRNRRTTRDNPQAWRGTGCMMCYRAQKSLLF